MRTTRQLSITLPNEMADTLRGRVKSGEYASESEVIREGLRSLWARDQAVEAWLRGEVAEAYDALVVSPPTNCEFVSLRNEPQPSDVARQHATLRPAMSTRSSGTARGSLGSRIVAFTLIDEVVAIIGTFHGGRDHEAILRVTDS